MGDGWKIIVHALRSFVRYPVLIAPLVVVWCVYAAAILYMKYGYFAVARPAADTYLAVFAVIVALSYVILSGCSVVLELIRQIESGSPSLWRAVLAFWAKDALRIVPLALVWAIIWFLLTVLEVLLSKSRGGADEKLSAQSAAQTLAGDGQFSFSAAFIQAINKGVRMLVFLILPAIIWDRLGTLAAIKRGLGVLRAHVGVFASGYALTYAAATLVFLPPFIMFELGEPHKYWQWHIEFPQWAWMALIVYIGMAWSFSMYLEQMFMAQLYAWHLAWETATAKAGAEKKPVPRFEDVQRPVLFADAPGLFA